MVGWGKSGLSDRLLKVGNRKEFYDRIKDVEKRAKALFKEE